MCDYSKLKLVFVDVDGTLTDSGIYYDSKGNEIKKFSTRDYMGVNAAHYVGIKIVILTGRVFQGTETRSRELKVDELYQNIKNKKDFVASFLKKYQLTSENVGYIGDDLNDYASMKMAGFKACPLDACIEIKEIADYISPIVGGNGVLQDIFRHVLGEMGKWNDFIENVLLKD